MSEPAGIVRSMTGLWLALGLVLGLAIGFFVGRQSARAGDNSEVLLARAEADAREARAQVEGALSEAKAQLSALQEKLEVQTASAQQQQSINQRLDDIVKPLNEELEKLRKEATDAELNRAKSDSEMRNQIETLIKNNETLRGETSRLAGALAKGQSRGQYGEMQLERLLESVGFIETVHFRRQDSKRIDGATQRPDIVVLLSGGGEILVDAKFPFDKYAEALAAEDAAVRASLMQAHVAAILTHCKALSDKDYFRGRQTPDFVVMFLPYESLLSDALASDALLLEKAFSHNIILATPTSMLALLRTISYGWSQRTIAENAEHVRARGLELLDRLGKLVERINAVGNRINQSAEAFNEMATTFDKRVIVSARKMEKLGLKPAKPIGAVKSIETVAGGLSTPAIEVGLEDDDDVDDGELQAMLESREEDESDENPEQV